MAISRRRGPGDRRARLTSSPVALPTPAARTAARGRAAPRADRNGPWKTRKYL